MTARRIESSDVSRVSITIGVMVALVAIGVIGYFVFYAFTVKEQMTGFDPNRPVPDDATLHKRLTAEQYHVVREAGTETAFKNKLWDNFRPGIYVDIITREPLFSSADKFDSGTGRPCFTKPISPDLLVEQMDSSNRVEVRSKRSNAHLGHVFQDNTTPTGKRYAINSIAMYFIPAEEMDQAGYGAFKQYATAAPQAAPK
jgi:peptide methionine sulfoxide reductase msrA/msrB